MTSSNRQLSINITASILSFVFSYAINFLLTPYIVRTLGAEAYGFVGLGTQIIGYSSLITIALNSMAGRFVTIEYHRNNIRKANTYMSSVFYSNLIISILLLLVSCILIIYLDLIINIPQRLVTDVKLLFSFLAINSIISLLTNVYGTACFIKNRLDYSNIQNIIGNIIRAICLLLLFSVFAPRVWFFGVTGLMTTIYIAITNLVFTKRLTPDLGVNKKLFNILYIKELLYSGVWNLVTKLSSLLESGLNLLFANLFVGAKLTGIYALSTTLPIMINSICSMMATNFSPSWTQLYAVGDKTHMFREITKSIRIMSFFSSIPIAIFVVNGKLFYHLWLPTEDNTLLYWLAVCSSFVMIVAMPLEPLWNIFTITNKVKESSINLLEWSLAMFICVIIGMQFIDDNLIRLFIIASVKSILGSIRTLTFLPLYGAKCLESNGSIFYISIVRNIICLVLSILPSFAFAYYLPKTWCGLFLGIIVTALIGCFVNWFISLNKNDKDYLKEKIEKFLYGKK